MRTPVLLVGGQGDTDAVVGGLLRQPGTLVVEHRFDGHIVRRTLVTLRDGELITTEDALELAHGCVACTIRNDLLILLRRLHRRRGVDRIVVHLAQWLEPEPICWAINHIRVRVGPGYPDGPAACDVAIAAVVTCVDTVDFLTQALGDDELADGRTVAQVVVGQAEFADLVVLNHPDPVTLAVLRRLTPRARITVGVDRVELALAHLDSDSRRGRSDHPHAPLLAGLPPLAADGTVRILEFTARRPFHPERLHAAVDLLLDGVVRTRGRLWLANRDDQVMWLESAGGGLRVGRKMVGGNDLLGGGPRRPRTAGVRRSDVGAPVRRSAHLDDDPGVRRQPGRDRRSIEWRSAQRRRDGLPANLEPLRRSVR
jgi:G3E family GTPase